MKQSALATVALLGTSALAGSVGQAVVVNSCKYDVHLCYVPAMGGGFIEVDSILSPGQKWSETWTELTNLNGWSIKLSKDAVLSNIMQYEYTFHNDGIIWYDLSDVNGNPWDGNWEITSDSDTCTPKQQAYRYSTDDAYGMQSCPADATITVTLCSGEEQNDGAASSASTSVAAESTAAIVPSVALPTSTEEAPATTPSTTTIPSTTAVPAVTYSQHGFHGFNAEADESTSASPTTFATSTLALEEIAPGVTVWEVETAVVTEVVTALYTAPSRVKRHEHHAGHHNA